MIIFINNKVKKIAYIIIILTDMKHNCNTKIKNVIWALKKTKKEKKSYILMQIGAYLSTTNEGLSFWFVMGLLAKFVFAFSI